jgi:hypothetical protein
MLTMSDNHSSEQSKLWVGFWKNRRHVVFDPSIQPADDVYMLLYFVEGKSLCYRSRETERTQVKTVRGQAGIDYAIEQYLEWKRNHTNELSELKDRQSPYIQDPDALNVKCPNCKGDAISYLTVGTFSEGAFSDGVNQREVCNHCNGTGVVPNVY